MQQGRDGWWRKRSSEASAFSPQLKLNTHSFHLTCHPHTAASHHTHTHTQTYTQSHKQTQNKDSQQLWDGVHKHHLLSNASKTHILSVQQHLLTLHNVLTHIHKHTHTHTQKQWQRQIQRIIKRPRRWSLSSLSPSYTPSLSLSSCLLHFHVQCDDAPAG